MLKLIDADALEAYIKDYACIPCKEYGADRDGIRCDFCGFGFCLEGIKRHMVHDAEPVRHGHWIERTKVNPDLLYDSTYNYECSDCGYWDTHGADVEVPYCWHCGAKMDL